MGNCMITRKGGSADFKEMAIMARPSSVYFGIFGENNYISSSTVSTLTGDYMQIKGGILYILKAGNYRYTKYNFTGMTCASVTNKYAVGDTITRDTTTYNVMVIEAL